MLRAVERSISECSSGGDELIAKWQQSIHGVMVVVLSRAPMGHNAHPARMPVVVESLGSAGPARVAKRRETRLD